MAQNQGGVLEGQNIDEEAAISPDPIEESKKEDGEASTPSVSSDDSKEEVILDWDTPDDPANPHNWTLRWKIYHTAIPALYGFIM